MAFLIIFGIGLLLTIVTFVLGELFDFGGGDADAGGDVGERPRRSARASSSSS